MPVFGVDDVLFLLASTTALLWLKRGEIVQDPFLIAHKAQVGPSGKGEDSFSAKEHELWANPRLLLRGFDLEEEDRKDRAKQMLLGLPSSSPSASSHSPNAFLDSGNATGSSLVSTSIVTTMTDSARIPVHAPNVPHRHYNPSRRLPHVTLLAAASEKEVQEQIKRYSLAEVHSLFDTMEMGQMWQSVITVSRGIERAHMQLQYLTQRNVEGALRTLLTAKQPSLAVAYYLSYGEDMLPSDDIVAALFDACRFMDRTALQLCRTMGAFRERWSPVVYACCLTALARLDPAGALQLYEDYVKKIGAETLQLRREKTQEQANYRGSSFKRVLTTPSILLQEGGLARLSAESADRSGGTTGVTVSPTTSHLQHLHHIMIPMIMVNFPHLANRFVEDMLRTEPEVAPDVFLRCLWTEPGRRAATTYLRKERREDNVDVHNTWMDKKLNITHESSLPAKRSCAEEGAAAKELPLAELAFSLYQLRPSPMNMNSLLRIVMAATPDSATKSQLGRNDIEVGHQVLPFDPELVRIAKEGSPKLRSLFTAMPLQNTDADAAILARGLTEHAHSSGAVAAQFMAAMIARKRFTVVPALANYVARRGHWDTVARAMSVYLSNQRSIMSAAEVSLCVEASVKSGRWSSALFWVERAHSKGLVLPPETYDTALSVSSRCQWEAPVRVLQTMHEVGGVCTERGALSVFEAAANQGKIAAAMDILMKTGSIQWVP